MTSRMWGHSLSLETEGRSWCSPLFPAEDAPLFNTAAVWDFLIQQRDQTPPNQSVFKSTHANEKLMLSGVVSFTWGKHRHDCVWRSHHVFLWRRLFWPRQLCKKWICYFTLLSCFPFKTFLNHETISWETERLQIMFVIVRKMMYFKVNNRMIQVYFLYLTGRWLF